MISQLISNYSVILTFINISRNGTTGQETIDDETATSAQILAVAEETDSVLKAMLGWEDSRLAYDDWCDIGYGYGKSIGGKVFLVDENPAEECATPVRPSIPSELLTRRSEARPRIKKRERSNSGTPTRNQSK